MGILVNTRKNFCLQTKFGLEETPQRGTSAKQKLQNINKAKTQKQ